ncbi:hypothetical protein NQ318_023355, partial [Aromia moschata]
FGHQPCEYTRHYLIYSDQEEGGEEEKTLEDDLKNLAYTMLVLPSKELIEGSNGRTCMNPRRLTMMTIQMHSAVEFNRSGDSNVLSFLRQYEQDSYSERLVQSESEIMNYKYHDSQGVPTCL